MARSTTAPDPAPPADDAGGALRAAAASLDNLAARSGECAMLARIANGTVIAMEARGPAGPYQRGTTIPFWRSAAGQALVASMPRHERRSLVEAIGAAELGEAGYSSPETLGFELDLVAARGYAIVTDEHASGTSGVAAPVLSADGMAAAAVSIVGQSEHLPRERLHALGPVLIEATREASALAGGAPKPMSAAPRPVSPVSPAAAALNETCSLIGEAPVYDRDRDRLFWVDMYDPAIHRFDRARGELKTFHPEEMITALALAPNGLLAAARSGVWLLDPETGERLEAFGHPERHIPTNRFNDGKCDSHGRFWVNTVDLGFKAGAGALYRWDAREGFATMETGLNLPNGLGWSPDNRLMYLADTADRAIYACDFDEEAGTISNRRPFVRLADDVSGAPDGLAVDAEGNVWVALFDGWRVSRFSPGGELRDEVVLPAPRPTSCALGGRDGRTLFVTTARLRVPEAMLRDAPLSGAVFQVPV